MKSMLVAALTSGLVLTSNAATWSDELSSHELREWSPAEARVQFTAWAAEFSKDYTCAGEEAARFGIWLDNLQRVAQSNSRSELSYKLRMNQFGDLTDDEFRAMYNCLVRDKENSVAYAAMDGKSKDVGVDVDAPSSVDWTTQGVVTPIKNQGQCGSCWAFSATGDMECRYAIKNGRLNSLSEQQLVDCSGSYGNYGCNGGWYYNAWKYAEADGGLCSEAEYPYTARDGSCRASSCGTKYNDPSSYSRVTADSDSSLESATAAGCVSVAIEADQFAFQYYSSGVLTGDCGTSIDHAVLVVGYGSQGGQEYWKVKNSWGTSWGEQGYVLICRNCNANGSRGECGINMYPYQVNY